MNTHIIGVTETVLFCKCNILIYNFSLKYFLNVFCTRTRFPVKVPVTTLVFSCPFGFQKPVVEGFASIWYKEWSIKKSDNPWLIWINNVLVQCVWPSISWAHLLISPQILSGKGWGQGDNDGASESGISPQSNFYIRSGNKPALGEDNETNWLTPDNVDAALLTSLHAALSLWTDLSAGAQKGDTNKQTGSKYYNTFSDEVFRSFTMDVVQHLLGDQPSLLVWIYKVWARGFLFFSR